MTNREHIETYDNREFARFLAWVAGYCGNKEEVEFWEHWLKAEKPKAESERVNCENIKCENCTNHNYCDYES